MRFRLLVNPDTPMITPEREWKRRAVRRKLKLIMSKKQAYGAKRQDVPHRLREMRNRSGMTLEELAAKVGKDWRTVQKHETEPGRLRVIDLKLYADAIGCSVADLIADAPPETHDEHELIEIVRHLSPADRDRLLKIARALDPDTDNEGETRLA